MNIIFFGTPEFAAIILQKLIDSGVTPVAVVTAPDKPAGRGQRLTSSPVKLLAAKHHISLFQPEKLSDEQFLKILQGCAADVFIIAAYGKILPQTLLSIPPKGTINVHPSLLPRHRGPSPIQSTVLSGDEYAGVTLMLTDEKMDHGPILTNSKFKIQSSKITYQELHDELAKIGAALLIETLPKWIAGEITPQEQDHAKATFTKLLTKENGHINWSRPAMEIDRVVRALNPWPGAWSYIGSPTSAEFAEVGLPIVKRVKILAGHPLDEPSPAPPGTLIKTKSGQLAASTGDMFYLIEKLQIEGKTPTKGENFLGSGLKGVLV